MECERVELTYFEEGSVDRVFQAGSRYRKVQGFLVVTGVGEQTVNKASHKRIASTYTIYDMGDVIPAGFVQPVVGV